MKQIWRNDDVKNLGWWRHHKILIPSSGYVLKPSYYRLKSNQVVLKFIFK